MQPYIPPDNNQQRLEKPRRNLFHPAVRLTDRLHTSLCPEYLDILVCPNKNKSESVSRFQVTLSFCKCVALQFNEASLFFQTTFSESDSSKHV